MIDIRVKEAIEAFKHGEMIIVMDDEERENEGDLEMAGIFSSPEKINFMAQEARGLICVSITEEIADKLELPPMVKNNDSNHETAFTVSIDAKEAKTGISAYERDLTIGLMCKDSASPDMFVRPGHIFPLIAKNGGVLVRTGHTEASVDLCRICGIKPIAIICEIMKKDGTMAKRGDKFLSDFSKKHNLKTLYVSDLIEYRLKNDNLVDSISKTDAIFLGNECFKIEFKDHVGRVHTVYRFDGKDCETIANSAPIVKFHSIKSDIEFLTNDGEFDNFIKSIEILNSSGGYLIFINDMMHKSTYSNIKSFGIGAQILKELDISDFRLISSHDSSYVALGGFGLKIADRIEVKS